MIVGTKGKLPWITYNGVDVEDSQLCIDYLNKECGVDLSRHLSPTDRAIARAFVRMMEEAHYW